MGLFKLTPKGYLGIWMIIASLVLGKIFTFTFFYYFNSTFWRWFSVVMYVLTWPLLFVGIYWAGKEYADSLKKYVSYHFYQEELKKNTQKALHKGKEIRQKVREKINREKLKLI